MLDAWRETELFTPKERAALALVEAVTLVAVGQVPDEVYEQAAEHLTEKELIAVVMATVTINSWNRIAITCRTPLD